jgi:hypothetical protein
MSRNLYSLQNEWMTIRLGKAEYVFRHRSDPSIQLDTWLVQQIAIGGVIIMSGTDVEGPIKQVGAADFIGGIHGDEQFGSVTLLVDGKPVDPLSAIPETPFDRIDAFVTSTLFFCDSRIPAFERHKHLLFAGEKVVISNAMTYIGQEDFFVHRWPANGIFSFYKDTINGYTTNRSCILINDRATPPDPSIDVVSFYGNGFCATIRSLSEKYGSYLGWVTDFAKEARPRFKAYFDTLDNAHGDVVLHPSDEIQASYEIWIV